MFNSGGLERALRVLGALLEERGLSYEVVVIGGGALLLQNAIQRPTKDLDVLALVEDGIYATAEPLPVGLVQAVREVADALDLAADWLNAGPTAQLLPQAGLPLGFESRVETVVFDGLTVYLASRFDQICFKLYATVDQTLRSKHADDLKLLQPTEKELIEAANWVRTQDIYEGFGIMIAEVLAAFGISNYGSQT